jgi:hypothetical protein
VIAYTCKYWNISVVSALFIDIFQHNQQYDTLLPIISCTHKLNAGIAYTPNTWKLRLFDKIKQRLWSGLKISRRLLLLNGKCWCPAKQANPYSVNRLGDVLCLGVLCGTLQRESLADFGKMVPDFTKVVSGMVTKHTAFVNRKCYGNFVCVYN